MRKHYSEIENPSEKRRNTRTSNENRSFSPAHCNTSLQSTVENSTPLSYSSVRRVNQRENIANAVSRTRQPLSNISNSTPSRSRRKNTCFNTVILNSSSENCNGTYTSTVENLTPLSAPSNSRQCELSNPVTDSDYSPVGVENIHTSNSFEDSKTARLRRKSIMWRKKHSKESIKGLNIRRMSDLSEIDVAYDISMRSTQSKLDTENSLTRMESDSPKNYSPSCTLIAAYSQSTSDISTTEQLQQSISTPNIDKDYWDIGDPTFVCVHCGAHLWYEERIKKDRKATKPEFSMCCANGKVKLPLLKVAPDTLLQLHSNSTQSSRHFLRNIRMYNMIFSFTSFGGKVDGSVNSGSGPYCFRVGGQVYHLMGSLLPIDDQTPKFAQLYIYDTEHEVDNRLGCLSSKNNEDMLDPKIVTSLKDMLDKHNSIAQSFRYAKDRYQNDTLNGVRLRLIRKRGSDGRVYNLPSASEVAALIVGDIDSALGERDIIVESQNNILQRIDVKHPLYLGLQYPLLFPYGEDGYRDDVQRTSIFSSSTKPRKTISMREFFSFRLQTRSGESQIIQHSRKLFQQFLVDAYTMIENERLTFIRFNQVHLRADLYQNVLNAFDKGEDAAVRMGKRIIIPSSFTGRPRYMAENCKDAFAIFRWAGYPHLFITITCNPKWPEISRFIKASNLNAEDRPDIMCRVFKLKLDQLLHDLRKEQVLGKVNAYVCTIEFQKRGLPHAHILLFLHPSDKPDSGVDIDKLISAEIPDKDTDSSLFAAVTSYMMHGPCGPENYKSPCMKDGKCSKRFPKKFCTRTTIDDDGFPHYKRRNDGRVLLKNGVELDNRFVVPYNAKLLLKYQAHISVEYTCQSNAVKYLFKYIHKGNDRVTAAIHHPDSGLDEIKMFYDCRYVSACEAGWRIFGFDIHCRYPPVQRLPFHMPNEKNVIFRDGASISDVKTKVEYSRSIFESWMDANKKYPEGRHLTYAEFPTQFVYREDTQEWHPRKKGFSIGRINRFSAKNGEDSYLRILLNIQKGCTSYNDLRTINGVLFPTFKDACYSLGLLDDDNEYIDAIKEANTWGSASYLRNLFALLLFSNSMARPEHVWETCWKFLSEDILYRHRKNIGHEDAIVSEEYIKNAALSEIDKVLQSNGRSLNDYPSMPQINCPSLFDVQNRLVLDELLYDRSLMMEEHAKLMKSLTDEQRIVFDKISSAISKRTGGFFFLYGFGGTGKTFIWNTLSAYVRSNAEIVLNVASSGIASLLLPGGRTAHSRFRIPIQITKDSTCNIKQNSPLAELLSKTKLIIWDEAPMVHRFCFEALDKTLRDVLRFSDNCCVDKPFGGKVVVLGGDFRQILPVIPHGSRQEIVNATINSSPLWSHCQLLTLTKNMRLNSGGGIQNLMEIKHFSEWLLKVGDGDLGDDEDGESMITIPDGLLIKESEDPLSDLINFVYPKVLDNLLDATYFKERAILTPKLVDVAILNELLMSLIPGEEKIYLSSDNILKQDHHSELEDAEFSPEILNTFSCSGLPNHKLTLKVNVPVMLLRNIDQSRGLCNGTRLLISRLGNRVIEEKVLTGSTIGQTVLIPRMAMTPSSHAFPVNFQRRQFPLVVSFAMTINKSQGQSLSHIGVYLRKPVFTHGQLYVALSRVKSKQGLKILILDEDGNVTNSTINVVYKEVFQRLM